MATLAANTQEVLPAAVLPVLMDSMAPPVGHAGIGPDGHLGAVIAVHVYELRFASGRNSIEALLGHGHVGSQYPGGLASSGLARIDGLNGVHGIRVVQLVGRILEQSVHLLVVADRRGAAGDVFLADLGQDANTAIAEVVEALWIGAGNPRPMDRTSV